MARNSSRSTARPFTSRDLLDHIYAPILPIELAFTACACGAHTKFQNDTVSVWFCNEWGCRAAQVLIPLLDDDAPDPTEWRVLWKSKEFQFFAGRWWDCVRGERVWPVPDWNLCRELDRRSGKVSARPVKPVAKIGKQYRESLPKRKGPAVKSCWCVPLSGHQVLTDSQLAMNCPIHGMTCHNCGQDHHHGSD